MDVFSSFPSSAKQTLTSALNFEPYPSNDFYALDTMCFSELVDKEAWNLRNFTQFHPSLVCFLGLRSWVHKEKFGHPLLLTQVSPKFRKGLLWSGAEALFEFQIENGFAAKLVTDSIASAAPTPFSLFGKFQKIESADGIGFQYEKNGSSSSEIASGFLFSELELPRATEWIQTVRDLESKEWSHSKTYLRSPGHSFLYLLKQDAEKRMFVQEKGQDMGNLLLSYSLRFKDSTILKSL